jgi:hypothetical protein
MSAEHRSRPKGEHRKRCEIAGKYFYTSKKQALTSAARAGQRKGQELSVYKCRVCRGWHLTKSPTRVRGEVAILGSDLFDFDWKLFASVLDSNLHAFLDSHGV